MFTGEPCGSPTLSGFYSTLKDHVFVVDAGCVSVAVIFTVCLPLFKRLEAYERIPVSLHDELARHDLCQGP